MNRKNMENVNHKKSTIIQKVFTMIRKILSLKTLKEIYYFNNVIFTIDKWINFGAEEVVIN